MSRVMRLIFSRNRACLALAPLVLLAGAAMAAPAEVDRIVATVNNAVITQYELKSRLEQALKQLEGQRLPGRKQLEQQVLERMITEKALLQVAEDTGIRVDAIQVDRALTRIAQGNNMSLETFRVALEKDGVPLGAFREQVRTEMVLTRLREREVENRVVVTEAEVDNFLTNPASETTQQTVYNLSHIFIAIPEGSSPEKQAELKAKAEKALAELKTGADFNQVSASYSDAQNALKGGNMGWRSEAQLPGLFSSALTGMKQGDATQVLRSPNGFHILKLNDKRGNFQQMLIKQTRARHILVKLNEVVNDAEARQRLLNLKERIEQGGASFEDLAKLNSDDLSASRGGDLGWLNPGDTVPEFERAMDSLKDGEISAPIQSPFGWHLIQVLERREQDVTQDRKRLEAKRALRDRKSEEAFEDWVRQVRDRAYVEIRLDE